MRIAAVALTLVAPVPGPVARVFEYGPDPFRAGQHRGVDLAARPGDVVRAACSGRVATARMRVVTLRCGPWRVTHLPLAAISVRAGARVRAGEPVGRLGSTPGHTGLHLGVRRATDPFGYVDPIPLIHGTRPPLAPARRIPRTGPRPTTPRPAIPPAAARPAAASHSAALRPAAPPVAAPLPAAPPAAALRPAPPVGDALGPPAPAPLGGPRRAAPPAGSRPAARSVAAPRPPSPVAVPQPAPLRAAPEGRVRVFAPARARGLAPWSAWVGLSLLLLGAVGGGVRIRARRRLAPLAERAVERVASPP